MFFSFNWQSNRLWYIVLFAIFFDIRYYISIFTQNEPIIPIIKIMFMCLGQMTCGILELIVQYRSRRKKKIDSRNDDSILTKPVISLIEVHRIKKFKCVDLSLLFLTSTLDLVSFSIISIKDKKELSSLMFILRMSQTIFIGLSMLIILRTSFYYHHILAISLITVSIIVLLIFNLNGEWINALLYILSYIINSFRYVIIYLLMHKYFYSPYLLLFLVCSIGLTVILLFLSVSSFFPNYKYTFHAIGNFASEKFGKNYIDFIIFFGIYLMSFLFNLFNTLTNQTLSPLHVGIGDTLSGVIIFYILRNEGIAELSLTGIMNVIVFVGCLIYSEIIIINCFGMKKGTINAIAKRGEEDTEEAETDAEKLIASSEEGNSKFEDIKNESTI